jgi:hypothetical protein
MGVVEDWGLTPDELNEILSHRPSVRGMLMGFVAEYRLTQIHFADARIHRWTRYDDHDRNRKGDFWFTYHGTQFSVELKSLQSNSVQQTGDDEYSGSAQVDASDRRTVTLPNGEQLLTTCLVTAEFDILAINLFEFGQKWRFAFAKNADLPRSRHKKYTEEQRKFLLATSVPLTWPLSPPFRPEPFGILNELLFERRKVRKKPPGETAT